MSSTSICGLSLGSAQEFRYPGMVISSYHTLSQAKEILVTLIVVERFSLHQ